MSRLDQIDEFESLFRRSEREEFVFADIPIESVAVVTGGQGLSLGSLDDLSGKDIHVRQSSSYYENLNQLNHTFRESGVDEVTLTAADEHLQDPRADGSGIAADLAWVNGHIPPPYNSQSLISDNLGHQGPTLLQTLGAGRHEYHPDPILSWARQVDAQTRDLSLEELVWHLN